MSKALYIFLAFFFCFNAFAQTNAPSNTFLQAVAYYSEEKYDQAYNIFVALSEKYPEDDAVSYYRGCSAAILGKNDEAETHLLKAYQLDSTNTSYLYSLANYYDSAQKPRQFALYGEKLLKQAPEYMNSAEVLSRVADGQLLVGKDSLALHLYDRLIEIIPNYPPAIVSKMYIYRKTGKLVNFFVCLEQMIDSEAIRPEYKCEYLKELVSSMDSRFYWVWGDTLLKIIDRNLELYPSEPDAHYLKIQFNLIKGERDEAIERSLKMIEAAQQKADNKKLAEAYSLLGDLYHEKGNKKKAYSTYKLALKVNPDFAAVLNNYAYFLSEDRKQLRTALKMSTRAIELEPDNSTYLDTHAWILFLLGRAEEAKPFFKHAMIYGGKESAVILEHYSEVLKKLGETELAKYYKSLSEQKKK